MRPPEGVDPALSRRRERREAERRQRARRRRAAALAGAAGLAALLGGLLGSRDGSEPGSGGVTSSPITRPACHPAIAASPSRLAGRLLIVRMEATATPELMRRARAGALAGVVIFPPSGTRPQDLAEQISKLERAALAGGSPPLLFAIDQEGGPVKRLPELPPERSPAELAALDADAAAAEREGKATGAALAELGINLDLAPVLDVPTAAGAFIAERAFGGEPSQVAMRGLAFARGLDAGGVGATAKHFPGLGLATANTDLEPSMVDATRTMLEPGLEPFREAAEAGVAAIMVANAIYPSLDARAPASLSRSVVNGLLREELGFEGVIVTDDLGAGAITASGVDEAEAAVRAARAGADLLLFALSDGRVAHRALVRAIRRRQLDPRRLRASCVRTNALAARLATAGRTAR
jgi:beta-N-acetylhexosaminidase